MNNNDAVLPLHEMRTDDFRQAAYRAATSPDSLTANGVSNPHDFVLGAMWARLHLHPNVVKQQQRYTEEQVKELAAVFYNRVFVGSFHSNRMTREDKEGLVRLALMWLNDLRDSTNNNDNCCGVQ